MISNGLTDSHAGILAETSACERCGSVVRVENGLCVGCLLQPPFDAECDRESFAAALVEIDIRDTDWRFGNYQILEEIGRGGMGVIYRARQRHSRRIVALKRILSHHADSKETLARFRREAEAAASLDHPNILPIYEVGEGEDGLPFFSMKYAAGGSLLEARTALRRDPRRCVGLMAKVARAVQYAHSQGILHRDLKPGNIMLDARGEPMVSDFGLAKWLDGSSDLTRTLTIFGTPGYVAPEQIKGAAKLTSGAADVYSLGAILFDLLAGRPPFLGEQALAVIQQASEKSAPKLHTLAPGLDRDLETICAKCLEREPRARYHSAAELAVDLERWLESRPIIARPPFLATRIRTWSRRNPKLATAAAACFLLGAAVIWLLCEPIASTQQSFVPEKTVAVLPFENRTEEKANAYFADGIHDEILTRLSRIADLRVVSRTSTLGYKSMPQNLGEIAKQLGVTNVLEGSVQKSGYTMRINVQLIRASDGSRIWAESFDRKLTDIFSVENEVAKSVADQLQARLTGDEEQVMGAEPTDSIDAYDAYLRGLVCSSKTASTPANMLAAQKNLRRAVHLDPKFALAWALLSHVEARGYNIVTLQPTPALRAEARKSAETALLLQPDLGEAVFAIGYYHYACLRNYDTAVRYFEEARHYLPNSSQIPESLACVARRRGDWDRSELYFRQAERLDPRNVTLLTQHALSYVCLRRFAEAERKLDLVLDIAPNDVDTVATKAAIAQAEGDLPRAAALLAPLHPAADDVSAVETQFYQAILERRSARIIPRLQEILAKPDPALGFYNAAFRFWLGWAQEIAGDHAAAQESWQKARTEFESYFKEQPENWGLAGLLAMTNAFLGNRAEALFLAKRAMAMNSIERDAMAGPLPMEVLARVAAQTGDHDRAFATLEKLLRMPYAGAIASGQPLTPALLRLDPMFDPLRNDPRFEALLASQSQNPRP